MANGEAVSRPKQNEYTVITLSDADGGEVMTLQRAAYVTEAQAHHDFDLPPLTQTGHVPTSLPTRRHLCPSLRKVRLINTPLCTAVRPSFAGDIRGDPR